MKIIEVKWTDAHRKDGWCGVEDLENWKDEVGNVTQIGYLYKETKDWVYFYMGYGDDQTFLNSHKIPRGMIKSLKVIRSSKEK